VPTTTQDFEDMMYAMKATQTHPDGFWSMNWRSSMFANYMFWGPNQMWTYPNSTWGTKWFINPEGEVQYGAATFVYDDMVSTYNKYINDGIMHPDALTLDNATKAAMCAEGQFGVFQCYHIADVIGSEPDRETYENWLFAVPLKNSKTGQETIAHWPMVWGGADMGWLVSADCEYKELIVYMIDSLFCDVEHGNMLTYGPEAGKDPFGLVEGWTIDEENLKFVPPASYETAAKYFGSEIRAWGVAGGLSEIDFIYDYLGLEREYEEVTIIDAVTGKEIVTRDYDFISYEELPDEEKTFEKYTTDLKRVWNNNVTTCCPGDVFFDEETSLRAGELQQVIQEYAIAEGAKFATGVRPLSELPAYHDTLKTMGIEELTEYYSEGYDPFLKACGLR